METILAGLAAAPAEDCGSGEALSPGRSPSLLLVVLALAGGALAAAGDGHRYLRTVASYRPPAVTLIDAAGEPVAFAAAARRRRAGGAPVHLHHLPGGLPGAHQHAGGGGEGAGSGR